MKKEELSKEIELKNQEKMKAYAAAIEALSNEHGCVLIAKPFIGNDGKISAQVLISVKQ